MFSSFQIIWQNLISSLYYNTYKYTQLFSSESVTFQRQSIILSSSHTTSTMKIFITLCVLFIGAYCVPLLDKQLGNEWALFKRVHQKQYKTNEEESARYVIREFFNLEMIFFFISLIVERFGKQIMPKFVNIILKLILVFTLIH
jgi:hypothetical protein